MEIGHASGRSYAARSRVPCAPHRCCTDEPRQAPRRTATHRAMLTISSHAVMALITLWIGFLEWGSKRPPCVHTYSTRVGLQAPRYCTFQPPACCTYRRRRAAHCAYAVHVPASAAPFVPRTVAPQAPPRQLRGAQAVPRRLRRRPPAVLTSTPGRSSAVRTGYAYRSLAYLRRRAARLGGRRTVRTRCAYQPRAYRTYVP